MLRYLLLPGTIALMLMSAAAGTHAMPQSVPELPALVSDTSPSQYVAALFNVRNGEAVYQPANPYILVTWAMAAMLLCCIIIVIELLRQNNMKRSIIIKWLKILMANEALHEKNERLTHLNRQKDHYMYAMAHDLRGPISCVKGLTDLLQAGHVDKDEERKYYSLIGESLHYQLQLIDRMLDIARLDSGKSGMYMQRLNVVDVLRETISTYSTDAEKKGLDIHFTPPAKDYYVEADKICLRRVFDNLVSNAVKFSRPGKRITLSLHETEHRIVIKVTDMGPGISDDDLKKLFVRFNKLSAKPTAGERSTGLGLSIVKDFVEAMNGDVWCESKLHEGSSFVVSLKKVLPVPLHSFQASLN